jgi:hypothetical protein
MTNEEILREINALPLEAQRQIKDFVVFCASVTSHRRQSKLRPLPT